MPPILAHIQQIGALLIFAATYLVMALGRLPGLRIDRVGAALLGAALMVSFGGLPLRAAFASVDLGTLALLLGMMLVVAQLRAAGFFTLATRAALRGAYHPALLLGGIVTLSGLLSAALVNDTICLALTPLVLELVRRLGRRPLPYLLGLAMASNIGSLATITGNPQNMIIGSVSGLSYARFTAELGPVALGGLVLCWGLIIALHPREFLTTARRHPVPAMAPEVTPEVATDRALLAKTLVVCAALGVALLVGVAPARAALLAGAVLLISRRADPRAIYAQIDGRLLLMFAGLFVVVAGLQHAILTPDVLAAGRHLALDRPPLLAGVMVVLSNLVSNVPAVLVARPFIAVLADPTRAWLVVAMAATLAGNLTLLGSVANLIVAQGALAGGARMGFGAYLRVGLPLTVLTILLGLWWL